MKKIFAVLILFSMIFSFAGCGNSTKKNSEQIQVGNLSEDEKNFYESKLNEYLSAGIDEKSAKERALANLDGLKKCIEKVNKLSGDEKNLYDSKFQEYINIGVDKNSAIEKAYDDVREDRMKKDYEKRKPEEEEQRRISEERFAEQKEREQNYLANNYTEIYKWCYWMFYKIGYSDDVLQYHMSNGDAESMRDLNFVMNQFSIDLDGGQYSVNSNIPDNIRNIMLNAKNNLKKTFSLRKNGNYSEIQQSDDLQYQVVQQLIEIQSMLPEGVKYYSYDGIYDPNDELDIPSEYKNNGRVTIQTGTKNSGGRYGQI